jgi:Uma2 family endonuclease
MDAVKLDVSTQLPDHTQLPCGDGTFVENFQEHPQSILLAGSIWSELQAIHPDRQFCIGRDSGIYWRVTEPPERGAEAPDWFYVPDVPPALNGQMRRSYVMWRELVDPLFVIEFVSGNGREERDETQYRGKFWVYEKAIRVPFYGIYGEKKSLLGLYHLIGGRYHLMPPNARGHYVVGKMGVGLGIWQGTYKNVELPWLGWWDLAGNFLLAGEEQAEQEKQRAGQEKQRADKLAAKLRELGVEFDN